MTTQIDFDREYAAMRQIIRDLRAEVMRLQNELMILKATTP